MAETALEQPKRLQRRYTEEDVERGLTELVLCGGNYRQAGANLRARGFDIPDDTLWAWKRETHAERYEETRQRLLPRIQAKVAAEAEDLAVAYAEREQATLQAFNPMALEQKDLPGAMRNLATAKAINIDKAQLLRGNPTSIIERRDIEDLFGQLGRMASVEGSAVEVVDDPSTPFAVPAQDAD